MATRKGVAILREIALVNSSLPDGVIKVAMLKELNDELGALYGPLGASPQHELVLPPGEQKTAATGRPGGRAGG